MILKHKLLQLIIASLSLTIVSSCKDHDWSGINSTSDNISYTLQTDVPDNRSRADKLTGCEIIALLDETSQDTLYLHPNIGDMPAPSKVAKKKKSRGTPIQTVQDFETIAQSFGVQAYTTNGHQLYISNGEVTKSGDLWIERAGERFWPGDGALDFYCVAPYNAVTPNFKQVTGGTGKNITFAYEVPKSNDGTKDAEAQTDIMLAYTGGVDKESNAGNVPLKFWHALAGIQFEVGDITGGTVQSITIRNIYGNGTATFDVSKLAQADADDPEYPSFQEATTIPVTWTTAEDAQLTSYTQSFDVAIEDRFSEDGTNPVESQPVTNAKDDQGNPQNIKATFMLMPQVLTGQAEIEIEILGAATNEVHTLKAQISPNNNVEWKAGKIYTYTISSKSINWTYVFEITPTLTPDSETREEYTSTYNSETRTLTHGHRVTHMGYSVVSYRYRTNNPSVNEILPWKATEYPDATNDKQQRRATVPFSDWLINLNGKYGLSGPGNFEDEISTHTFRTRMLDVELVTDCEGDKELYDEPFKGLPGNGGEDDYLPGDQSAEADAAAWDLSMHNVEGKATSQNTANCYIVQGAGRYKLPLIYGNAIRNGEHNKSAYQYQGAASSTGYPHNDALQIFIRHSGYDVVESKAPYIKPHIATDSWAGARGSLIWTDAYRLVENVHLDANKEYLIFDVNKEFIQQGNAVVALVQSNGVVIWSWHIWVTDYDLFSQSLKLGSIYNNNMNEERYHLSPVNLGWCDPKKEWFTGRSGHITFQQDKNPGKPIKLNIVQLTAEYESSYGNNTCYQFGRKDPFIGVMDHKKDTKHLFYTDLYNTPAKDYTFTTAKNRTNLKNGIRNPHIMYVGGFKHTGAGGDWNTGLDGAPHTTTGNSGSFHPYRNLWNNRSLPKNNSATTKRYRVYKTMYDPCPPGWVIPPRDIFRIFYGSSTVTEIAGKKLSNYNITYDNGYKYTLQGTPDGTNPVVFEATGQRWYSLSGIITDTGPGENWAHYAVYLWTCDSYVEEVHDAVTGSTWNVAGGSREISNSFYLIGPGRDGDKNAKEGSEDYNLWHYGASQSQFAGASAMARPIRPVREGSEYGAREEYVDNP